MDAEYITPHWPDSLPKVEDLSFGTTKSKLAEELYAGQTWDYAIPQGWLDDAEAHAFLAQIVWLYPKGNMFGMPAPVTQEAAMFLKKTFTAL